MMAREFYAIAARRGRYRPQRVTYDPDGRSTVEAIGPYCGRWEDALETIAAADPAAAQRMRETMARVMGGR